MGNAAIVAPFPSFWDRILTFNGAVLLGQPNELIAMSAKNKSENGEEGSEDVNGAAELFLQTLGLTDIVLGALSLYIIRLWADRNRQGSSPRRAISGSMWACWLVALP